MNCRNVFLAQSELRVNNMSLVNKPPFEAFYLANVGLIHTVSRKVHARILAMGASIEYCDVQQEATMVMMRAYEKFDESLGFKFSTYFMRAAFYDLNKFVKSYEKDVSVLGIFSLQSVVGEDGEPIDLESTIDGGFGSPEEILEAKQLLAEIKSQLSPLATLILGIMVEPPEEFEDNWQVTRSMGATSTIEMNVNFVGTFIKKMTDATDQEIKLAVGEIKAISRRINE